MGMKRFRGRIVQGTKAKTGNMAPLPKPRNERPFRSCKAAMKKFFSRPTRENYHAYQKALEKVSMINQTQAYAFKAVFKKQMFDKALKEEDFK